MKKIKVLIKTEEELKNTTKFENVENSGGFVVNDFYCASDMREYLGKVISINEKSGMILDEPVQWCFIPDMIKAEIVSEKHIYVDKDGTEYVFDKAF